MESRFVTLDCLVDNHYGIYIAQTFAQRYGFLWPEGKEDIDILLKGPDHEDYWEAWADVLDKFPAHRILLKPQIEADRIVLNADDDLFIGYYTEKPEANLEIIHDQDPKSPREDSNLGTMYCFHSRYNLGDEHNLDVEEVQEIANDPDYISLPIYMYEHSGITLNTGGFNCPWDSGQIGIIAVSKADIRKEYGWKLITKARREKILSYLQGEVNAYSQYLEGDIWGFKLEVHNPETDEMDDVDSCWGFYGDDPKTNGMLGYIDEKYHHLIK